jgi:hypothetical protein
VRVAGNALTVKGGIERCGTRIGSTAILRS